MKEDHDLCPLQAGGWGTGPAEQNEMMFQDLSPESRKFMELWNLNLKRFKWFDLNGYLRLILYGILSTE